MSKAFQNTGVTLNCQLQGSGVAGEVVSALKQKTSSLHTSAACSDATAELEDPATLLQTLSAQQGSEPKTAVVCVPAQADWTLAAETAYLDSLSKAAKAAYPNVVMAYMSDSTAKVHARSFHTNGHVPVRQAQPALAQLGNTLKHCVHVPYSILPSPLLSHPATELEHHYVELCPMHAMLAKPSRMYKSFSVVICRSLLLLAQAGLCCKAWSFHRRCQAYSYPHTLPHCLMCLTHTCAMTSALHKSGS